MLIMPALSCHKRVHLGVSTLFGPFRPLETSGHQGEKLARTWSGWVLEQICRMAFPLDTGKMHLVPTGSDPLGSCPEQDLLLLSL